MHSALALGLLSATGAFAQSYTLFDNYNGSHFFDKFDFWTGADPTDGFVDFLNYEDAKKYGLVANPSVPNWGVDHTNTLETNNATGRASVRLVSTATYNHGLFIADINHMPGSICGVWPAFWFLGGGVWYDLTWLIIGTYVTLM